MKYHPLIQSTNAIYKYDSEIKFINTIHNHNAQIRNTNENTINDHNTQIRNVHANTFPIHAELKLLKHSVVCRGNSTHGCILN